MKSGLGAGPRRRSTTMAPVHYRGCPTIRDGSVVVFPYCSGGAPYSCLSELSRLSASGHGRTILNRPSRKGSYSQTVSDDLAFDHEDDVFGDVRGGVRHSFEVA
jgi:hypothetical protein